MKNKKIKRSDNFRQIKTKIFFRTILFAVISMLLIFLLYNFILYGHFANWMVAAFQMIFGLRYGRAYDLYEAVFRNQAQFWIMLAIVTVFFLIFRLYLNWFVRYFREIDRGIDVLIDEEPGEVLLSQELSAIEKKINTAKYTLEKRKLDTRLAEQRKNDLIVYLAHDLKTPLASVMGYLNLLRDEGQISEELRQKYLSVSLEKAQRLEDLVNEFFEIAKFNLSNITLSYSRISLTRLLEMVLYEFQPMLRERNLSCELGIAPDIMIRCDADKLQRVFDNLLRNAVNYSFPETEIKITAEVWEEGVCVCFVNHGDTIPADKLKRIFEQFYRLDAARSTRSGGAGLGLAIAKQIVELHGGTITAKSEEGTTTFQIMLPRP